MDDDPLTRRSALTFAGATAVTPLLVGCLDDGEGAGDDLESTDDDDAGEDEEGPVDVLEAEPGEVISFAAITGGWIGKGPTAIEGVQNPTLVLEEGETYVIGWDEGDGAHHNIEIRDENDEIVDDLETEMVSDTRPNGQFLEFEATSEMTDYVCAPHPNAMRGEIVVVGDEDEKADEDEEAADDLEGEPATTVVLEGVTSGWIGKEPATIEGVQNPTLILEEGEEYTIGWDVGDGADHNIEIVNEHDEVVDDLETEIVSDPDDDQFLEFEATPEMAAYVCRPHPNAMRGEIVVEDDGNGR